MEDQASLLPACLLIALALSTPSVADEALSTGSRGDANPALRSAAGGEPATPEILDQLRRAKPKPPMPTPKRGFSKHRSGKPGYRIEDLGTVTKDVEGDGAVTTTPAGPDVDRAIKKGAAASPQRTESPVFQGGLDPAGDPKGAQRVERKVFGIDDRVRMTYTTQYPFRAIGILEAEFSFGSTTCSGALISAHYLLTGAHCVYSLERHEWARTVKFFPGYDGNYAPYGYFSSVNLLIPTGYSTASADFYSFEHMLHDIGLVKLRGSPGNKVGWLAFGYSDGLPPFVGNLVGYPGDKPFGTMWRASCDIDPIDGYPDLFEHHCDTYSGSSGSSIYDYEKAKQARIVYGVNVASGTEYNTALRITRTYFCWLQNNMEQRC